MPEDYYVTKDQGKLLLIGNKVIEIIKGLTPYGSGNQLDTEYVASHIRTAATYSFMENPDNNSLLRPRRILEIARRTGAGNCDQLGAMAYALCRDYLSPEYHSAWIATDAHTFALIGHNSHGPEEAIAVDAWPQIPQAVLYKHHFCYGMKFTTYVANTGTGRGSYKESKAAKGLNVKMTQQWNDIFNNAEIQNWRYENNNVVKPWKNQEYYYIPV